MSDQNWHEDHIPVSRMVHDIRVNPRDPSDAWVRQHLLNYNPALIGQFVVSHRVPGDNQPEEEWAILDGGNRAALIRLAGYEDQPQSCKIFEGLTLAEEATIAMGYNDRRNWLTIRMFQARLAQGDPTALALRDIAEKNGWEISTNSGNGKIRGIKDLTAVLAAGARMEIARTEAAKGTEQWTAAVVSGEKDGLRALEEAFQVFTAAFPSRPSGYAPVIIRGIALLLLRDGTKVNMERLTTSIRDLSQGSMSLLHDGRAMGKTMRLRTPEGISMLVTKFYNQGFASRSSARLDEMWTNV